MAPALLIIGLGNPGKEYEGTRHNIGFETVDAYYGHLFLEHGASRLSRWSSFRNLARSATHRIDDFHSIAIAKPTTYMNESGRAVTALVRSLQLSAVSRQLVVIHDDLDLPVSALRLSTNGASGGQKGVQSIIEALGTKNFLRLRIGIGPNETPDGQRIPAEDFVLKKFRTEERERIDSAIDRAVQTIDVLLRDGLPAAQRLTNTQPPHE